MRRHNRYVNTIIVTLLIALAVLVSSAIDSHSVPQLMSYHGKLNNSNGQPVTGDVAITFTIYDAETGGSILWIESYSGTQLVNVVNGLFDVELGTVNPLDPTIFAKEKLYLGITVENDSEMTPRTRLTTSAYAFKAGSPTTIQQYSSNRTYNQVDTSCGWNDIHSVSVPLGETWEIVNVYLSHHIDPSIYFLCGQLRLLVDGEVIEPAAFSNDQRRISNGHDDIGWSSQTAFYSPVLKLNSGQNITIQSYLTDDWWHFRENSCTGSREWNTQIKFGFYYYKY